MAKTIQEINEKIKQGRAVVCTAEEIIQVVKEKGLKQAAATVDVVTTGTFAPMCSSGAYFNVGHATPRMKMGGGKVTLNEVAAYAGFAAVDILIGATAIPDDDPRNKVFPGNSLMAGGTSSKTWWRAKTCASPPQPMAPTAIPGRPWIPGSAWRI